MDYEKGFKELEECARKLRNADEALVNCKGEDVNPPEAKAVQKATETNTCVIKAVVPIINQIFSSTLAFSRGRSVPLE